MEENRNTSFQLKGRDMDSILQSLEEGVSEIFTSERYTEYLQTMAKFHNYSFNNTMLIALQRPDATLVTGYRNWQSMGRQVMKGLRLLPRRRSRKSRCRKSWTRKGVRF